MTAHGPEARRLVESALAVAGIHVDSVTLNVLTGHALNVIEGKSSREGAIHGLAAGSDLRPGYTAKLLDLAVEALTANPQE